MPRHYLETISALGKVKPEIHTDRPEIKGGRIKQANGVGPRVIWGPVEIPNSMAHLTVAQAQAVFGAEGRFRNTGGSVG